MRATAQQCDAAQMCVCQLPITVINAGEKWLRTPLAPAGAFFCYHEDWSNMSEKTHFLTPEGRKKLEEE
jgi:hypothetical protein